MTVGDEPPAKASSYSSRHNSSPCANGSNPDVSAQAPPPVPQRASPTTQTDPPATVRPRTMDKETAPPTTSMPPPRPHEFPPPQPAQTTSSLHPAQPSKQSQQPAESKQSSGTIPMPPTAQDTNAKPARPEWQSGNPETPNANEKRPGNPKTPFNLDKAGSGGGREFHEVRLSFPTPPTAPQKPALILGVQPSDIDKETYLKDFENYLKQWNSFKNQIIGHYRARKDDVTKIQNSKSGDAQQYYDWLVQDDEVRGLFIAASEEHEIQFKEFMMLLQM
ncbi:hypothetical protein IL306_013113 [Fusarium sp. DS 682]|nr:hypothetical protein IL306_013113 [Fusarium sp. DS 682]